VLNLEKKVQRQDDEIIVLKTALADAIRRLTTLETGMSVCLSLCLSVCLCLSVRPSVWYADVVWVAA